MRRAEESKLFHHSSWAVNGVPSVAKKAAEKLLFEMSSCAQQQALRLAHAEK
jgi:hypothetical protein